MTPSDDEDVVELRHEALGLALTIVAAGWVAVLVGGLLYRELAHAAWSPLPLLPPLAGLLGALILMRRGRVYAAAWLLITGLCAGPAVAVLLYGLQPAALCLLVAPVVLAHMLLPPAATLRVGLLAVALMVALAVFGQPHADVGRLGAALALILLPAALCLLVAALLYLNALNSGALIGWALDSQRKDARRAELLRAQQRELQAAYGAIERANTELRLLNVELAEARRVAEVANQLKTRFLANVSHELRTPLHVILGLSAAGRDGDAPPTLARDLEHIERSGRHLQRLIDDLLDLSRAEIDALELFPQTLDAHALLADVFSGMATSQRATGLDWRLELPERLPLLRADPLRLRQILFNLLSNAARYTAQGAVTLGAAAEPPFLHLWVADTGSGIALDQQERIFEPFGAERSRRRPDGVGLGLSITRRLVALHGGSLTLDSQPGAGSVFHVYLPLPDFAGAQSRPMQASAPMLLLLAGQPTPAPEIAAIAERQRLPLRRAGSFAELERLLAEGQPAGVIWDLGSATPDDWPMIQRIRSSPELRCLPLLLFGRATGELPDLADGPTEFLVKPLSDASLAQRIHALHPAPSAAPILIVDDDPLARAGYRAMLARAFPQQRVAEADDGAAALALLAHERPALVLLDLMMPEVDGFAVLDALRANPETQRTPVLVLSGRLLTLDDVRRLQAGNVTFQSKDTLAPEELAAQAERVARGENALAPATSAVVKRAIAYIHENYGRPFSRHEIAGAVGVSERYLSDIVHQELGISLWEYLNRLRIAQAKSLLQTSGAPIGEVAARVGFENAHYFARLFRRQVGVTPSAFRQQPAPSAANT